VLEINKTRRNMKVKTKTDQAKFYIKIGIGVVAVLAIMLAWVGMFDKNVDTQFTVKQPVHPMFGSMDVIDRGGYYFKGFASTWRWDKFDEYYFSASSEEGGTKDESIRITFNGGGQAKVSCYVKITPPTDKEARINYNRQFSGNPSNVKSAIRSHLINCLKNTAPLMTASEHQSARKAEFAQLIEQQMRLGEFSMKQEPRVVKDSTDRNGDEITVYDTEIVIDENGQPVVARPSALIDYGITIVQFSITGTEYDPKTQELFAAKKESLLLAEKSKAEREQEVQQRLMVEEKGKREKAEMEAKANVERAEAVIRAEKEKEMAEIEAQKKVAVEAQAKLEAETRLAKELAIEQKEKEIAETKAAKEKEIATIAAEAQLKVAELKAQAALEEAKAIRELAAAEEERIARAGAITERDKVLAEIAKERDIGVAEHLSTVKVPSVTIGGSTGGTKGGESVMEHLINLKLLEGAGLLETSEIKPSKEGSFIPPAK
jgi:regulator of protease activity HflC (stomatin/prohibitin superfamily)